ncbi:hypothetical protein BDR07DRAFT_449941 [Suillus spraguei]|nr:hypothetical protein BDR07DRAFT_449941 [Suillus spraguei]
MAFQLEFHYPQPNRREHATKVARPTPKTRYMLNSILRASTYDWCDLHLSIRVTGLRNQRLSCWPATNNAVIGAAFPVSKSLFLGLRIISDNKTDILQSAERPVDSRCIDKI